MVGRPRETLLQSSRSEPSSPTLFGGCCVRVPGFWADDAVMKLETQTVFTLYRLLSGLKSRPKMELGKHLFVYWVGRL